MEQQIVSEEKKNLAIVCSEVRQLIVNGAYEECDTLLKNSIGEYPHAPEPHNFLGMLLENEGNHLLAMKHFRAAWALDPTYLPARHNLEFYGTFFSRGNGAFDESDCPQLVENKTYKVEYDKNGIGHVVSTEK